MAKAKIAPRAPAHKTFFSLREIRVTSTSGHTAIIAPNKPTLLPRPLWDDAFKSGAMEYDPELIRAAARAVDALAGTPAPAPRPKKLSFQAALEQAIKDVVAAADPADMNKTSGAPKTPAVKKAMVALGVPPKGLTSEQIYDTFTTLVASSAIEPIDEEVTEDTPDESTLVDEDGVDEPVGRGIAGLIDQSEGSEPDDEE